MVANTLAIDTNKLDVMTRRLGGGYGGKIFKGRGVAAAAAVAASALNRPVRMVLDIETNMEAMGKRSPYYFEYSVMTVVVALRLGSFGTTCTKYSYINYYPRPPWTTRLWRST